MILIHALQSISQCQFSKQNKLTGNLRVSRIPTRLSISSSCRCYSDAAVSITVTSATDFLSFIIGAITPFPSMRIFCLFTGVSVAFIYLWHLTLFGGLLALSGRQEKRNAHAYVPCVTATPRSQAQSRNLLFRLFCTGGNNAEDPFNPMDNKEHAGMAFFRDKLGGLLAKTWVKALVLLLFGVYIVVACWGVTNVREGLEKRNTANYDSYSVTYYDMEDAYFKDYAFAISVMFTGPDLDFANVATQERIETVMKAFEDSPYIDATTTQSWLRDFLDYVERNREYGDIDLPIGTELEFAHTLKTTYLSDPAPPYNLDVEFNANGTEVRGARFLIQVRKRPKIYARSVSRFDGTEKLGRFRSRLKNNSHGVRAMNRKIGSGFWLLGSYWKEIESKLLLLRLWERKCRSQFSHK